MLSSGSRLFNFPSLEFQIPYGNDDDNDQKDQCGQSPQSSLDVGLVGNIKLVQEKDLITRWVTKDGSVESVSINGDAKYKTTSSFRVDAEITITYHTFKDK